MIVIFCDVHLVFRIMKISQNIYICMPTNSDIDSEFAFKICIDHYICLFYGKMISGLNYKNLLLKFSDWSLRQG